MIDEKPAIEQLQRLHKLNYFPNVKERQGMIDFIELRTALQNADTPEIAKAVIDAWMAGSPDCPTPYDLRFAANKLNEERSENRYWKPPSAPQYSCKRCQDCGLYGGELYGQFAGPWKWCDCPAGVERREREHAEIAAGKHKHSLYPDVFIDVDSVAEGNQAREKILRRWPGAKSEKQAIQQQAEVYHGDF